MQAVAAQFRAHPAATLRDEMDGIHLDQCEAFLSCLKLATSYLFESMLISCRRSFRRCQHWGGLCVPLGMSVHETIHRRQDKEDKYCGCDHATYDDARQGLLCL